jgi:hypothetical protein
MDENKFNLILKGKKVFYSALNNKIYYTLVINNKDQLKFMNKKFKEFNKNINTVIGIDFEFKKISKETRDIALVQINLETENNIAYIFIFYPPNLDNKGLKQLNKLLCNKKIVKVIHGAESLDILYIFNTLLNNNKNKIKKFIYNLYDTKFLCEYYHLRNDINASCSIYDLLEELKVFDNKQVKYLEKLEKKIGEIYLIEFDIDNLNIDLIEYALFDVIYLPTLLNKFKKILNNKLTILKELTGIVYYYKRDPYYEKLIENINELNNNFIIYDNNSIKLIDIYNFSYYYKFNDNILVELSDITYFKKFVQFVFKYIIYQYILNNFTVYISKNIKNNTILDIIFDDFFLNNKYMKNTVDNLKKNIIF